MSVESPSQLPCAAESVAAPWRGSAPNGSQNGFAPTLASAFDQARRACGAFEWVTLTYLAWLLLAISLFHKNLPAAATYATIHAALFVAVLALAWAAHRSSHPALHFVRSWYFLPLWLFLFEELTGLVHMISPRWFDSWLIGFDRALFGVYPWDWLAQFAGPALTDFMQFSYMTYFLALIVLPAILYARGERRAFWAVLTSMAIAHYAVYVLAVLLPIESPFHAFPVLQSAPLDGGPVAALMNLIERFGRVRGAAFPSAHVAGAFAALLGAWRYRRWLFWVHLPLFTCMVVSTVYGRYHYAADGLAGLLVGAIAFRAGHRLLTRPAALPENC
jgi:membrane-associated phospholipid phosphatase